MSLFSQLSRREFVWLLCVVATGWPLAAHAQQAMPAIPKESSADPAFTKAMEAVKAKLKDPQSARYSDMVRKIGPAMNGKPAEVVCGRVYANDTFGVNGANRRFVYFIADGATFVAEANPMPEDVAQMIYGRFCK
jgi:hypothetical protein